CSRQVPGRAPRPARTQRQSRPCGVPSRSRRSDAAVGAVAERTVLGMLAAAEPDLLRRLRFVGQRRELAALVRAVAEGLVLALAAGAPEIALPSLHLDAIGRFLCDPGLRHALLPSGRSRAAPA